MTFGFDRRVRGFRLIDLITLGCLIALVFGVYLAKTMAGHERAEIARIERQIAAEQRAIRLLTADVTKLETPERLERLSETYLGLKPVEAGRETPAEGLGAIAAQPAGDPPVLPSATPAPAPAPAASARPEVAL